MNAIVSTILIAMLLFLTRQCGKEEISDTPECVRAKIREIQQQDVWNPPAKIYSYAYQGQKVYFIPQHCCDIPSQLLDAECSVICNPDGGFTGRGDGRCSDFFTTRTDEKLLWEDSRAARNQ